MKSKPLPHSVEAEMGVLGSMMHGEVATAVQAIGEMAGPVDDWFHVPAHVTIYDCLVKWWKRGRPFNLELFTKAMDDRKLLAGVGGAAYVTSVFTFVPGVSMMAYYLEDLANKRWLRCVALNCAEVVRQAYEEQDDVEGILRDVEATLMKLSSRHTSRAQQRGIASIIADLIQDLSDPEKVLGISTGYTKLDALVGGLAPYAKIVVAGLISGGKSAFAQCLANSLAVDRKIPVAIFTFEMSAQQTAQRIIQIRSEVSVRTVADKTAELFEMDRFSTAAREVAESPLHIIDERLDIAGIRARCMQLKPRVAIIDYLQIVPEKKQRGENRTDQLDRMSAETKQIAHSFGMTLIELSQLTEKDGKMTTRGSKGITADSDQLWIIEGEDDESKMLNQKFLTVAKQRDGARGQIPFTYVRNKTKFRQN